MSLLLQIISNMIGGRQSLHSVCPVFRQRDQRNQRNPSPLPLWAPSILSGSAAPRSSPARETAFRWRPAGWRPSRRPASLWTKATPALPSSSWCSHWLWRPSSSAGSTLPTSTTSTTSCDHDPILLNSDSEVSWSGSRAEAAADFLPSLLSQQETSCRGGGITSQHLLLISVNLNPPP